MFNIPNFTSDQQFTSYKILSLLFPMMITIHQRNQNVSNNDDTFRDRSNPQVNKNPMTGFPSHTFIYSNYDVA